ncbi:hypothetical protein LV457_07810 [Mycobacterium sp. MYCO198283]|uniref:hypothetical protein n=1 Tax=Mycobacterium sp. MYCO198283 TaxID=2883505 RepID=UPI001E3E5318|nr:hypothetical protein [Mycobacterium sp. MYCO198283]MCG5432197.1 hypothetical protein [Mycobacterium sp. MYCO198283]
MTPWRAASSPTSSIAAPRTTSEESGPSVTVRPASDRAAAKRPASGLRTVTASAPDCRVNSAMLVLATRRPRPMTTSRSAVLAISASR